MRRFENYAVVYGLADRNVQYHEGKPQVGLLLQIARVPQGELEDLINSTATVINTPEIKGDYPDKGFIQSFIAGFTDPLDVAAVYVHHQDIGDSLSLFGHMTSTLHGYRGPAREQGSEYRFAMGGDMGLIYFPNPSDPLARQIMYDLYHGNLGKWIDSKDS